MQNYGLSHNALQLEAAVAEARQSHRQRAEKQTALLAPTPAQAIRTLYSNAPPPTKTASLTFERMFRAAAKHSAITEMVEA